MQVAARSGRRPGPCLRGPHGSPASRRPSSALRLDIGAAVCGEATARRRRRGRVDEPPPAVAEGRRGLSSSHPASSRRHRVDSPSSSKSARFARPLPSPKATRARRSRVMAAAAQAAKKEGNKLFTTGKHKEARRRRRSASNRRGHIFPRAGHRQVHGGHQPRWHGRDLLQQPVGGVRTRRPRGAAEAAEAAGPRGARPLVRERERLVRASTDARVEQTKPRIARMHTRARALFARARGRSTTTTPRAGTRRSRCGTRRPRTGGAASR